MNMMRVPGRKFVRRAMRPLVRRLFPGAVVLGYHRVARTEWDPLQLAVSPEHFSAHLAELKKLREIISLEELATRHEARERLDQFAVLTFDDGYVDFADVVVPLAAEAQVPVTVFVATGYSGRNFWWEEIAAHFQAQPAPAATALDLPLNGADAVLRFETLEDPAARMAATRTLCDRLACAPPGQVEAVLARLRAWSGNEAPPVSGRPMVPDELAAMASNPYARIGAHTVSHGCLALLSPPAQRSEIADNKRDLEAICSTRIEVFSYPNGSLSRETPALVRELGFSCACMSMDGVFAARGDAYRIPRLWVPDVDGPGFRRWLGAWVAAAN
jgi:peptidoglycan/xylan/chitin deacetylase (PgdA/CDA1 family)